MDLDKLKSGDPIRIKEVYGRLLKQEGEFGAILYLVTPHGSVIRSGAIWYRLLDEDGLKKLREFEKGEPRLYGGQLDHIIGCTERF
jgi:hypothetical protein